MRRTLSVPHRRFYSYKRKNSRKTDKLKGDNPVLAQSENYKRDKIFKIEEYDIRQIKHN